MIISLVKNASPDMILTAFDVKIHEKNDEIPPEACRALKKHKKRQCRQSGPNKKLKKINVEKVSSYMLIYLHYTFIYLHIPPNSFIYLHIPPDTSKY